MFGGRGSDTPPSSKETIPRKYDRSEAAKRQPRDEKGQFTVNLSRYDHVLIIDEFGNTSVPDDNRTVRGKMYDSKGDGLPSDLIQTNDYVTNAVRAAVETKHEDRAKIIGVKGKKLTRENEFPREDME